MGGCSRRTICMRAGSTISIGIPNWSHRRNLESAATFRWERKRAPAWEAPVPIFACRKRLGRQATRCLQAARKFLGKYALHTASRPIDSNATHAATQYERKRNNRQRLESAGARKAKRCCHRRQRQDKLKAGFCLRGLCGCFESHLRRQKFSLLHSFLRNRTQDAVCQAPQLLPTGIVLVLHLTLHSYWYR